MSWGVLVGAGVSLLGSSKSAKAAKKYAKDQAAALAAAAAANAKISKYDSKVALKKAAAIKKRSEEEFSLQIKNMNRIISGQKVGFAARGVRIGTGTALDVQARTAYEAGKDAEMIIYNGRTAEAEAKDLSTRYLMLADAGLKDAAVQGALITSAASMTASNIRWQAVSQAATSLYSTGQKTGWWK